MYLLQSSTYFSKKGSIAAYCVETSLATPLLVAFNSPEFRNRALKVRIENESFGLAKEVPTLLFDETDGPSAIDTLLASDRPIGVTEHGALIGQLGKDDVLRGLSATDHG